MAKASDNVFPKVLFSEVVPATPAAGTQVVYLDPADHKLKRKDSSGAVTTIEGGAGAGDPTWTTAALQNSWVNFDTTTYAAAGYRKDASGFVHLRGLVKSGTSFTPIFTLPAGYRPAMKKGYVVASNGAFGQVGIYATGTNTGAVILDIGSTAGVYLDGISFYADA